MRVILPVRRSGWAIAAGYLGICSLVGLPGPIAVIVGVIAIIDIVRHRGLHGMGRAIFGIVMGLFGSFILYGLIITLTGPS